MSLKHQEYCILNTQYSKDEYQQLAKLILESMTADGSWGKFFPKNISAFGYNETVANDWYPLTRTSAVSAGYNWGDITEPSTNDGAPIPNSIHDVTDALTQEVLICEETKRPYKLPIGELNLLRSIGVPVPKKCPDARQADRLALHSPWELWTRACAKTGKQIQAAFSPERPEKVYSVEAYLDEFN